MKKHFLFILLCTIFISVSGNLFASPIKKSSKIPDDDWYIYVSNDCLNEYQLKFLADYETNNFGILMINKSYVTGIMITLTLAVPDEDTLDELTEGMKLSEIEDDFKTLRKMFVESNIEPVIEYENDKPIRITYMANY